MGGLSTDSTRNQGGTINFRRNKSNRIKKNDFFQNQKDKKNAKIGIWRI